MTRPSDEGRCDICGEPMPEGEEMFRIHGYSGPCPKPPLPVTTPTHCACVWHGQADGLPFSECHYHATLRTELAVAQCEARDKATIIALRDAELAAAKDGWRQECDDADDVCELLGLRPDAYRTEGGSLNIPHIRALLHDRDKTICSHKCPLYMDALSELAAAKADAERLRSILFSQRSALICENLNHNKGEHHAGFECPVEAAIDAAIGSKG